MQHQRQQRVVKGWEDLEQRSLAKLRNVGKATLGDFETLGIATVGQLANADVDILYVQLCELTGQRHDPCVRDVFTAAIHQAKTGEAVNWWTYTPTRTSRQSRGTFPLPPARPSER